MANEPGARTSTGRPQPGWFAIPPTEGAAAGAFRAVVGAGCAVTRYSVGSGRRRARTAATVWPCPESAARARPVRRRPRV